LEERTIETQSKNLENSGLLPNPELDPITSSMDSKSRRWFICGGVLLTVTLTVIIGVITSFTSGKSSDPQTPDGGRDLLPWLSISKKALFKVSLVLESSSDTSQNNGGWIEAFSDGHFCKTKKFDFIQGASTELFVDESDGCSDFKMNKNGTMSIKVRKESGSKIAVYRVHVMLEDGQEYRAFFQKQQSETLAESFPLKIQQKERKVGIKLKYKQVQPNKQNLIYVKNTKVDLKLKGHDHISCQTNPLPWPAENGTVHLDDLQLLGTCHTFSMLKIRDNLQARLICPKQGEFIVTSIGVQSTELEIQAADWFVMPVPTGLPENTWLPLFYDGL